jgi:hypothetical protein
MFTKKDQLLHDLKVEELVQYYRQMGFDVLPGSKVADRDVDLVARKDGQTIVIEVKTQAMLERDKKDVADLALAVRNLPDHKFELKVASLPQPKEIEVANVEQLMRDYIIENFPEELGILSTHTAVEDVGDIDIYSLYLASNLVHIKGRASVTVSLQFGASGDQEDDDNGSYMTFPFSFDVELDRDLEIAQVHYLSIDTSSFYE